MSIPHLYIPGRTQRPARRFEEDEGRRSCVLAVCIRMGHQPLVVELPSPEEKVRRAKQKRGSVWLNPESTAGSALTSANFIHYVLKPLARGAAKLGGTRRSQRSPVLLVLDRGPLHTSEETQGWSADHNIELHFLPARASDLDPLDYGVFGGLKQAWRRAVLKDGLNWEQSCTLFKEMVAGQDFSGPITGCLAACASALWQGAGTLSLDILIFLC